MKRVKGELYILEVDIEAGYGPHTMRQWFQTGEIQEGDIAACGMRLVRVDTVKPGSHTFTSQDIGRGIEVEEDEEEGKG